MQEGKEIKSEVSHFLGLLKQSNHLVSEDYELYEDFLAGEHLAKHNLSVIYSASESEAQLSLRDTVRWERQTEEAFDYILKDINQPQQARLNELKQLVLDQERLRMEQLKKLQECVSQQNETILHLREQLTEQESYQNQKLHSECQNKIHLQDRDIKEKEAQIERLTLKQSQLKDLILTSNKQYELLEGRFHEVQIKLEQKENLLGDLTLKFHQSNLFLREVVTQLMGQSHIGSEKVSQIIDFSGQERKVTPLKENSSKSNKVLPNKYQSQPKTPLRERDQNKPKSEVLDSQYQSSYRQLFLRSLNNNSKCYKKM